MNKAFIESIEALERERGISKETLFKVIENALVAAYKKEYGAKHISGVEGCGRSRR